jgi:hypothetical protein
MMGDTTGSARRKQLLAAISMLSLSLGMSSTAVADQVKGEAVTQKVTGQNSIKGEAVTQKVTPGSQSAVKLRTQSSIKVQGSLKQGTAAP